MTTLIYSTQCTHCHDIMMYIQSVPVLQTMIRFHDIQDGVPMHVTRVPSLITAEGVLYVGKQIRPYLASLVPSKIQKSPYTKSNLLHNKHSYYTFKNPVRSTGEIMTPDLYKKINTPVMEALTQLQAK